MFANIAHSIMANGILVLVKYAGTWFLVRGYEEIMFKQLCAHWACHVPCCCSSFYEPFAIHIIVLMCSTNVNRHSLFSGEWFATNGTVNRHDGKGKWDDVWSTTFYKMSLILTNSRSKGGFQTNFEPILDPFLERGLKWHNVEWANPISTIWQIWHWKGASATVWNISFLIGGQNAHIVKLAVWKTAYVIATIDFIAGNMSTRFLFLFRLTRYFLGLLIGKKKLK